ncbi:class I SAM-dependent methyltransferase [Candidatus Woesearchaeota archaeon]|nr:class I SAM-dependent methyltransferase [Candidatus Woesearchaeota archaeon]
MKGVFDQQKWNIVANELEAENLKLASYDNTLIPSLGNLKNRKILDYGCGPGVLALALSKLGANVKTFDISKDMLELCSQKIGQENVFSNIEAIPKEEFDNIICNLVLCIVPEYEIKNISSNIRKLLNKNGTAYIGFCNPRIFNLPESRLDLRYSAGYSYEDNHSYRKIKKEGGYEITELHRPIEWYKQVFNDAGLVIVEEIFTPEYELSGNKIRDFIIFKLRRK